MKSLIAATLLSCTVPAIAFQQTPADSTSPWKHGLVAALTFSQVSYSDWAQGGQSSLAYAFSAEGKSERDAATTNWSNDYKFAFGQARLGDQGLRKTDDKIDLQSVIVYKIGPVVGPYGAATLKTQFAEGVEYDATGKATVVSRFFDPGYLTQSAGASYHPITQLKERIGVAVREIFTSQYNVYSDDPKTIAVEKTKVVAGFESVTEVEWKFEENILFTAKLECFTPFRNFNDFSIRGDNTLAVKVGKFMTMNLNWQFINEPQVAPRTQMKETLAIGLSYALL